MKDVTLLLMPISVIDAGMRTGRTFLVRPLLISQSAKLHYLILQIKNVRKVKHRNLLVLLEVYRVINCLPEPGPESLAYVCVVCVLNIKWVWPCMLYLRIKSIRMCTYAYDMYVIPQIISKNYQALLEWALLRKELPRYLTTIMQIGSYIGT